MYLWYVVKKRRRIERRGRPAQFTDRVRLHVFLERAELGAVQRAAEAAGTSASRFARQAIRAALIKEGPAHAR